MASSSIVSVQSIGDLHLGDRVIVTSTQGSKAGTLRFLGNTEFATGQWAGVELDDPVGKNDGAVAGTRYFDCQAMYGLFAPVHKVSRSPANTMGRRSDREAWSDRALEIPWAHQQASFPMRHEPARPSAG